MASRQSCFLNYWCKNCLDIVYQEYHKLYFSSGSSNNQKLVSLKFLRGRLLQPKYFEFQCKTLSISHSFLHYVINGYSYILIKRQTFFDCIFAFLHEEQTYKIPLGNAMKEEENQMRSFLTFQVLHYSARLSLLYDLHN